jgi:hypothetical protein
MNQNRARVLLASVVSGLSMGLYAAFWSGWPLMFGFVALGSGASIALSFLFEKEKAGRLLLFTGGYVFFTILFVIVFTSFQSFNDSFIGGWYFFRKFSGRKIMGSTVELWPSALQTVDETRSVDLKRLVILLGNPITAAIALVGGVVWSGIKFMRERRMNQIYQWLTFLLMGLPLIVMSMNTERMTLFLVLPFSVFVVLGLDRIYAFVSGHVGKFFTAKVAISLSRVVGAILLMVLVLPMTFVCAHVVAARTKPIMNDVWYEVLTKIKEVSPPDAVVHSWWPPGHFITAIAARGVSIDGAGQHVHESYWIARALLSDDERISAGLLRMVNSSGSDAASYLAELNLPMEERVRIILESVAGSREAADFKLQDKLNPEQRAHFLDLTHGAGKRATFVLIYNDLNEQNLAVSLIANWDFSKAAQLRSQQTRRPFAAPSLFRDQSRYFKDVLSVTGDIWKYTPEAHFKDRQGDALQFDNGLRISLNTMEAFVSRSNGAVQGAPRSLFYMEGDQLIEKNFSNASVDISALLINRAGKYSSVLADRRLLSSLLFRIFYLQGQGLKVFKPFALKEDPTLETTVYAFQIDWNAME